MFRQFFQRLKYKAMARQLRKPAGHTGKKVGLMMNKANTFLYEFTLETMQLSANDAVLEIGFGNGNFFQQLYAAAKDLQLTGLDFSDTMVKAAAQNNQSLITEGKLSLIQGSSNKMPFADNSFDKIFCINVIYFWDEPHQHLQEIKRVLKPGGQFFATIRTKESLNLMPFTKYGFTKYTESSWNEIVEQNGLQPGKAILKNEPEIEFQGNPFRIQCYCLMAKKLGL
jgi:ubiquinone/menaquinone biosynthesis C-methylase UbiE